MGPFGFRLLQGFSILYLHRYIKMEMKDVKFTNKSYPAIVGKRIVPFSGSCNLTLYDLTTVRVRIYIYITEA